jgi:branched-chain amino acid:cation transporter, LIVCS family
MSPYKAAFTAGFAMFAMFFGSGNLVFPLMIGVKTTDQYILASLGLLLTGVLVPFLGLFSMVVFQGDKERLFGLLGKYAPFILSILILSLIGPFGVVPRCILVSYGGMSLVYPNLSIYLFSAIFIVLIFFIIWQKNKIVPLIGKYLGPLKIFGIVLIILTAINHSPELVAKPQEHNSFMLGMLQGYQTMDLMASFFFSMTIIGYLRLVCGSKEEALKISVWASIIGAALNASVYIGFVFLGAHYAPDLVNMKPEQYLVTIAQLTLGSNATIIVALTIFLSCLVTASSLVRLFAEFLMHDVVKDKISWIPSVSITLIVTFIISLTGFDAIANLLGSVLVYIYPALITLAVTSILHYFYGFRWVKEAFWLTLVVAAIFKSI